MAYIDGYYVFAPVTKNDRSGLLWVASILSLVFSALTIVTRAHIKKRAFGNDDWFILAAEIIALGQYVAVFAGMDRFDLGKSTAIVQADGNATLAGQAVLASNCLFVVALGLSKCSVICFMKRLFTRELRSAWIICNIALGMVGLWTLASILILTIGCGPASNVAGDRCIGMVLRWGIVSGIDGLFELGIVLLSVILVLPLQMSSDIKLAVVSAFVFRIFVAVFSGIHVGYISDSASASDPGLAVVASLVWQQIELGYALISATIPTLKSFIRGYERAMGWESSYAKTGTIVGSQHQLQSFHTKSHLASRHRDDDTHSEYGRSPLRPDQQHYKANVTVPHNPDIPKRMLSTGSGGSQDPIIRKDVDFTVSSESAV
ncbi:hypothetical protein MBLNU459_g3546t2 [Dothideomycetes sp. NU459]